MQIKISQICSQSICEWAQSYADFWSSLPSYLTVTAVQSHCGGEECFTLFEWSPLWMWEKQLLQAVCHFWFASKSVIVIVDSENEWNKIEDFVIDWK